MKNMYNNRVKCTYHVSQHSTKLTRVTVAKHLT